MVNGLTNNRVAIGWPLLKYASDISGPIDGCSLGHNMDTRKTNAEIIFPVDIRSRPSQSYQVLFDSYNSYYGYYDGAPAYIFHVFFRQEMEGVYQIQLRLMDRSGSVVASHSINVGAITDDIVLNYSGGEMSGGTFTLTMGETELFTYTTSTGEISSVKFRYGLGYQTGYSNKSMATWLRFAKLVTFHAVDIDYSSTIDKYFNIADGSWSETRNNQS